MKRNKSRNDEEARTREMPVGASQKLMDVLIGRETDPLIQYSVYGSLETKDRWKLQKD
jgi:hypothetical protein